ncbi:MAG: hypothetical protein KDA80_12460 [Planctomycetaceae bacterium]|nr:hypothetical protein [Planctomycetaceae bacterium]
MRSTSGEKSPFSSNDGTPADEALCRHEEAQGVHSDLLCDESHTTIQLGNVYRIAIMITPQAKGDVIDQAWEVISTIREILRRQPVSMSVTSQTVFVRSAEEIEPVDHLFRAYYRDKMPATNYVVQPPCGGEALAIEAWGIGGDGVNTRFARPNVVEIDYDQLHWVYLSGIKTGGETGDAYSQSQKTFERLEEQLELSGMTFRDVVRAWIYQGGITALQGEVERYRELNRARADFFHEQESLGHMAVCRDGRMFYPASTGIGTLGRGLVLSCMALRTDRDDVRLLPLENPQQTSAFNYAKTFSAKSPKFSRAMAVVIGDYITTWVSGTASILQSESVHLGDVEKQTEQTIDNIENLIGAENFAAHGLPRGGARLTDLAKIRVYVKHPDDLETCRAICEKRFGSMPAVYAQADVCRSNLLVEIEGVAFSQLH